MRKMASYDVFSVYYDRFLGDVDYSLRAAYFDLLIKRFGGGQKGLLLDLACGTGSLSVELSRLGYEVIGADASPAMLALAQNKAISAGESILFLCQRMEELDLYGTVRAAVCALDSLNHLTSLEQFSRAVSRAALFLEPGGVFVFDLNTPYKHREVLGDNCFVFEEDDTVLVWRNRTSGTLLTEISLDFFTRQKGGLYLRESEQFAERAYTMDEVKAALEAAKLRLLGAFGDDSEEPPCDTAQRWVIVAQKAEKPEPGVL